VVLVAGALFLLYLWFSERDLLAQAHRGRQRKGTYRAMIIVFVVLALVMLGQRFSLFHLHHIGRADRSKAHHGLPNAQKTKRHHPAVAKPPKLEFLPIALATAGGLILLAYIGARS